MNYHHFITEIQKKVSDLLDNSLRVEVMTTRKNNGHERIGISIIDPHINISPTIYLEEFYASFQHTIPIDDIAHDIVTLYNEIRLDNDFELDQIQNFDYAKEHLAYKLINLEKNKDFLETLPHKRFMDLAIVLYLFIDASPLHSGTILITSELANLWQVSTDELFQIAHENMADLLPADLRPMQEVVCELLNTKNKSNFPENHLYVLTNDLRTFGAACLLYDDILDMIAAELNESFYIIPSSVHELIIIPESRSPQRDNLDAMILEINQTQLQEEEILSDHSYYYDFSSHILS